MDRFAQQHEPMHLDKFFSYTTFDNAGEAIFSKSFGFIRAGKDLGGSIANSRTLNRYVGIAGYYVWIHRLFVANPVITWSGLLPMGHLFKTSMEALKQRKAAPDARFDIAAHWLKTHQENPNLLSYRDIEAQTATSVAAGSDTLSCKSENKVPN
jgi:cytochrome P450